MADVVFFDLEGFVRGGELPAWAVGALRGFDLIVGFGTHDPDFGKPLLARYGWRLPAFKYVVGDPAMASPEKLVEAADNACTLIGVPRDKVICVWRARALREALRAAGFSAVSCEAFKTTPDGSTGLHLV